MEADSALALIGALLLVLVPGGAVAHVLGLRGLWWLAGAPTVSVAIVSVTGVVAAPLRIRFAWWEPAAVAAVVVLVVLGLRRARGRRLLRPVLGRWNRGDILVVLVVVVAAVASAAIASAGIGPWTRISQTYDGAFHLNAVAWIQSTGDASSFDLYRITHPGTDNEFYPAAWHALVASTVEMTGVGIPVATNAVWFAVQSAIWMPGIALLGAAVARPRDRRLVAALTAIAAVGFVGFPDLLLAWGTLYPTALAYALLPFGLAVTTIVLRYAVLRPADRRLPFPVTATALLAVWTVASAFAHPRSLFGYVLLAAPLVAIAAWRTIRRIWRSPRARRPVAIVLASTFAVVLAVVVVGAVYVYRTFDLAHRPISDHLNGGPATATQGLGASLLQALTLAPPQPDSTGVLPAAWIVGVLVMAGAVVALGLPRARWLVIALVLGIAAYVLAAGSNSDIAKVLTGVWYKDKFRLFSLLPIVQAPLVALVGAAIVALVRGRARTPVAAVVIAATAAAAMTSNVASAGPAMIRTAFALPVHDKNGLLLDRDEQRLLEELPRYVPPGDIVAGDPWDGSALSWALGDRRALFPHFAGEWTPDQLIVASRLDELRTDPAVCAAVDRLGVRWVVEDPQLLWGGPPESAPFAGFHRAVASGVLTPVARIGSAGLYRIPSCTP